ncbi:class I SAM-dependent RNA methyltransferase [Hoyosella sp. G463]|uniref:Class I SAM-dependent RNA methyltransferase n=1 Tax=Lolliginicoccus lacisalsi TaxID=2742202 RepID=A0A927PJW9_9ACTN|nr:class I SAM-dependent RNA methyltransferase [Lolliginicoccus lacisalsi]MBD8505355.1 class I SAM-dependent RNA methyltransferase [Lolliginicoccus lacisalsi]
MTRRSGPGGQGSDHDQRREPRDPGWVGREVDVVLGDPAHGGFCVARHEGRVVFVRHGIPGERVLARVTEDRGGGYCFAVVTEVIEASEHRVEPLCPVATGSEGDAASSNGAGCCDLSHMDAAAQRDWKARVVEGQLRRIAHIERAVRVESLHEDGEPELTGWRTRVRLAVDREGNAGYRRYRGSEVVADLRCPQAMAGLLDGIGDRGWRPGCELLVVADSSGQRHIVETVTAPDSRGRASGSQGGSRQRAASRRARAAHRSEVRILEGSGDTAQVVGDAAWELPATGFWQAHRHAAERYSAVVREWSTAGPGDVAWDLYSGAGVFAHVLAGQVGPGGRVEAVEADARAVAAGEQALAGLPQVRFHAMPTARALPELAERPTVVVLDPPRAGAGREVIERVAAAGPDRIIHIGCDPAAFARDCALYAEQGYELADLRVLDAFPLTHHMECVALLQR